MPTTSPIYPSSAAASELPGDFPWTTPSNALGDTTSTSATATPGSPSPADKCTGLNWGGNGNSGSAAAEKTLPFSTKDLITYLNADFDVIPSYDDLVNAGDKFRISFQFQDGFLKDTEVLKLTFDPSDFSEIPAGSTIDSIQVDVECQNDGVDYHVYRASLTADYTPADDAGVARMRLMP